MFTFPVPPSFRPQDHGWELIDSCRPGRYAPPSRVWERWVVPRLYPQALVVFAPSEQGRVYAGFMDDDMPEKMALADLLDAIA